MSDLKPCPLCQSKAKLLLDGEVVCPHRWGPARPRPKECPLAGVQMSVDAWQALPRPSEAVREVAGEMLDFCHRWGLGGVRLGRGELQAWAARLKATAGPGPAEVWVRWLSGAHKGNLYVVITIEETVRLGDPPGYCWVRVRVQGAPTAQDAGVCDEDRFIRCVHCGCFLAYQGADAGGYEVEVCDCRGDPDCEACDKRIEYEGLHARIRELNELRHKNTLLDKGGRYLRAEVQRLREGIEREANQCQSDAVEHEADGNRLTAAYAGATARALDTLRDEWLPLLRGRVRRLPHGADL